MKRLQLNPADLKASLKRPSSPATSSSTKKKKETQPAPHSPSASSAMAEAPPPPSTEAARGTPEQLAITASPITPVAETTGKIVTSSPLRTPNFRQIEGPSGKDPARFNVAEATGKIVTSSPLRSPNFPQIEGPSGNDPARINEFCLVVRSALRPQPFEPETDVLRQSRNNYRRHIELLYERYLIQRELPLDRKRLTSLVSELKARLSAAETELDSAREFASSAEAELARLCQENEEEKALVEAVKKEKHELNAVCRRLKNHFDDFKAAAEVKEQTLHSQVTELHAKEKSFCSELQREISELRMGVGVNWEEAAESADFAPVRNAIFKLAVKLAKDAAAEKYPELSFDFLEVEDGKVEEEIHSQGAALGPEGLRAAKGNVETGEGEDGAAETLEAEKVADKESGAGTGEDGTGRASKDVLQAEQA